MHDPLTRQERIDLRTSTEVKTLITRAAVSDGLTVSAFLLKAAQERAKQVLAAEESIVLSSKDWQRFFDALDHADCPRPKLSSALQQYRERHGTPE